MALSRKILLIFFVLLHNGLCQRTPIISHITQGQILNIGETAEFNCSVQYAEDYPVIWMKNSGNQTTDPLILSVGQSLVLRDSRLAIRLDHASATYSLQIKDIQERDAGRYECQVIISVSNKITAGVDLLVRRPPIILENSSRWLFAKEGDSAQMACYADGFPPPVIKWIREDDASLPTVGSIYWGNILNIAAVHKEDQGTYVCVAENGADQDARRSIKLEVQLAPVVTTPGTPVEQDETQNKPAKSFQRSASSSIEEQLKVIRQLIVNSTNVLGSKIDKLIERQDKVDLKLAPTLEKEKINVA